MKRKIAAVLLVAAGTLASGAAMTAPAQADNDLLDGIPIIGETVDDLLDGLPLLPDIL